MDESGEARRGVVKVDFESLSPERKAQRVLRVAEDYWATVEQRVDKVQSEGLEPEKALAIKCNAATNILIMLNEVSSDMTYDMLGKASQMVSGDKQAETVDEWVKRLGQLRYGTLFTPEAKGKDEIRMVKQYWDAIHLDTACQMAEIVASQHPGLSKAMENPRGQPFFSIVAESGQKLPRYVETALQIHGWLALIKKDEGAVDKEFQQRRLENVRDLVIAMEMSSIREMFSEDQWSKVDAILDYGEGLALGKGLMWDLIEGKKRAEAKSI
jgi:hypothetical protein